MKLQTNIITQTLATIAQVLNANSSLVPVKYQWVVAASIGFIQIVSGILAHLSNPDGTPATTAWKGKSD